MKRACSLLLILAIAVLSFPLAQAETEPVSIKELPGITSPVWKQTYEAYGRTIDVDTEVYIPETENVPILTVKRNSALAEPLKSELEEEYKKADRKDKTHYYDLITRGTEYTYLTYIKHAVPLSCGKTKKTDVWKEGMTSDDMDLIRYDPDQAYAENNSMTVREAETVAKTHLKELYPGLEAKLDTVLLFGRNYWKKSKKMISERGYYSLEFNQCFRGIPSVACIQDTYLSKPVRPDGYNWNKIQNARIHSAVYGEDSWSLVCQLYQETGVVKEDVSLLPFDAVKDRVEALIMNGNVRWINSVSLGYVLFDTNTSGEYMLAPCWVVWCEYLEGGPEAEKEYGVNDDELFFTGNNGYYKALIFDAQTGRMFDMESTADDRFLYPGIEGGI